MIILSILLGVAFLWWMYWCIKSRRMDRMTASLPCSPTLPLIGHGYIFLGSTEKILKNLEAQAALASKHKYAVKFWLGPKLYVAIASAEDAQVVLENCLEKDSVYRFLRPWLGYGLFVAPLNLWRVHRKVLLPLFHNKIVEEYVNVMGEQSEVLVERLKEQDGKGQFDVLNYITACTLDIVFETAMSERMDVQHKPETPYLNARSTVIEILNKRFFKVWLQPDPLFKMTPYAKQQDVNIELTHKFTDEVVKKKRIEHEKLKSKHANAEAEVPKGKCRSILDMLFSREIEFTDEQLREHIDSITIAGNDTTALVIAYTLVLLGIHKDTQERAYKEQREIFGSSRCGATKEDLQKMHFLERVLKESMRLYTVVPIIARNVQKDTYFPRCGVTVPAGSGAVVAMFAIHRSEHIWGPNANEFDPDRFLPERSVNRHPAAFLPFSYGTRNCIGRNFGMLILKSIVSSVIRSYSIEADDIGPLKIEMLLFPIKGHQIRVTERPIA